MRKMRDLVEIEPSSRIGGACLEGRAKFTVHVEAVEHDPDHVSRLSCGGLILREPTREIPSTEPSVAVSPVSSASSRCAAASADSPQSIPPPGNVHIPLSG